MSRPATFVLGTAGHIDHGKTSLVRALTGVDTDRWKEEKERGITIDLGFARLTLEQGSEIAIVDVPGHEAFVRNMLAGASGLDAALLVVAADEGPMPQTLEHLAILDLMGVNRGVVALTKRDLVDAEWADLVEDEVNSLLAGTSLEGAPVIATSAAGAPGVDDLRNALESLATDGSQRSVDDVFRMPVDRAFSVRGTGTVVTGTVWSGRAKVGDRVHVSPGGKEARIRRIHAFGDEVPQAVAGSRAALALTGIERDDAPRGTNVVNAGWWEPTLRFTARIRMTTGAALLVPDQRVRIHLGTAEVMARVHPFGGEAQRSTEAVWAEVRLEDPLLVRGADRFVIRSYSPVTTIGGGIVLEPFPPRRRMKSTDPGDLALSSGSAPERLRHALVVAGDAGLKREEIALWTGVGTTPDPAEDPESTWVALGDRLFARSSYNRLRDAVLSTVADAHAQAPLEPGAPIEVLRRLDAGGGLLISKVLSDLESEGTVESEAGWVRETGVTPTLTAEHHEVLGRLTQSLRDAGLAAPKVDELKERFGESTESYVAYLVRQNEAVRLSDDFVIARAVLDGAAEQIRERLGGKEGLGPADFREVLPVSRRHLVPILSHMDVIGVTVRRTDARDVPA